MPQLARHHNILHKEEDMKNEELATTHDVLELPTDLVTTIVENESKGNDICGMVTQGEHSFDAQDLSVVHTIVEQSLVEHSPILPLLQDDYLAVICDKKELRDSSLANSMPQLACHYDALSFESKISAANSHVILIGSSSK